jgi:heme oxygenase-like protein
MMLPTARGPLTTALIRALREDSGAVLPAASELSAVLDPLADDDLQLALWICYELHYRGFDDVADEWEWQPALISLRAAMEGCVLEALRREVDVRPDERPVAERLRDLVDSDDGPQLSRFLQTRATAGQFAEFVVHRSLYQHKEADPHTWAIPRLAGRAKAALVEIQLDEYGAGRTDRMHQDLYRKLMRGLGLDDSYSAYVDSVPGISLAIGNVMTLLALHRGRRGALVGHLAAYEMTSSAPCRRYARGLRRLGADDDTCDFYDEHVTADALHEQVAMHDLCGGLAEAEPELTEDIVFGAAVCLHVENRLAEHILAQWDARRSSLRTPLAAAESELADVS